MKRIEFKKCFIKSFKKLPKKVKDAFDSCFLLFLENPYSDILHNHSVHPTFEMGRSINITGDYRAIYIEYNEVIFSAEIGTHSQLY